MIPSVPRAAVLLVGLLHGSAEPARGAQGLELALEPYAEILADADTELANGDPRRARDRFEAALTRSPRNPTCAYGLACCAGRAGEPQEALRWLERASDWGFVDAELSAWDEDLAGLRGEPEFQRLLGRMRHGLEERLEAGPPPVTIWHGSPAWADQVVLSPDGDRALTRDGVLWDLEGSAVVALLFQNPARAAVFATFGPRGIAATADRSRHLLFHDPRDGSLLARMEGRAYPAFPLSFDAAETRLAMASSSGRTRVWDLVTEEPLASFETSGDAPAVLSPLGDRLLTLGTARAALWRVDEPLELWSDEPDRRASWAGEFDEQGDLCLVLARDAGTVTVLDAEHGAVVALIRSPEVRLTCAAFRARERAIVTGDEHGRIESWDAARGVVLSGFQAHAGAVRWTVLSSDGVLLMSSGEDGYLRAWDLDGGELLWERRERDETGSAPIVSFDRGARRVVLPVEGGAFELREPVSGRVIGSYRYPVLRTVDADFDVDGRRLALLTSDGSLRLVDVESGATRQAVTNLGPDASRLAVSPAGDRIATSSLTGEVHLFDASDARPLASVTAYEGERGIPELAFSPSGRHVLTYGRGARVGLLDAENGALVRWIEEREFELELATWSLDAERFAVADSGHRVRIHDADASAPLGRPLDHRAPVRCLAFAPGGEALLTGADDGVARLFDLRTGAVVRTLRSVHARARGRVVSVDISPDGARALTALGDSGVVVAWELATGEELWMRELGSATPASLEVRFSSDARRVLVAGQLDRGGYVLSAADGSILAELGSSVGRVVASPNGRHLIGLGAGSCRVFDTQGERPLYRRIELDGGDHLLLSSSGHCAGSPEVMGRVHLLLDGDSTPLDALAAVLFDPKRLRAARAGVTLAPPRAMRPPRLTLSGPLATTYARDADGRVRIEGRADDPTGVLAVEVRRGRELLARVVPEAPDGAPVTSHEFELGFEPPPGAGGLELRVLGGSGLESRAARLRVR